MRNFYEQFKTPIVIISLIFLAFIVYTKIFGPVPFYINSVNTTKTDLFSSSGQGEITEVPDQATIYVGVTKSASTVQDAQNQTNIVTNKLIEDLKKIGILTKDIKTTNYSVNPIYSDGEIMMPTRGNQNGYEVSQNLEIKIKPLNLTNKIIDLATRNGANLVGGVNFTFSDELEKSLEQKATQLAVDDAKQKAQTLSNAAGVRLGKIINVVSSTNNPRPLMMTAQKNADDEQVSTNITPGQNTLTIGVTIYYETY